LSRQKHEQKSEEVRPSLRGRQPSEHRQWRSLFVCSQS
jgi:hypothetical protein